MLRATLIVAVLMAVVGRPLTAADPKVLRIGISASLLDQLPPSQRAVFSGDFSGLVRDFTGLKSVSLPGINAWTSAKQLDAGKWDVGVFQAIEFAWVQEKYPQLEPFMVASDKSQLKALLVVSKENGPAGFADLKGKDVTLLDGRLHCRVFADQGAGMMANKFFGKLSYTRSGEDALDSVVRGKAQGAIVDTVAWDAYKDIQPGRFARLKIAAESPLIPAAAIVYKRGALSAKFLKTLKDGMFKVNQSDKGREALTPFHMKGFASVPANYQEQLRTTLAAFPPERH